MLLSGAWFAFTAWLALPWMRDLAQMASWPLALLVVGGIALVPGLMNAFLATSLLLDQRPEPPSAEARKTMLRADDVAECVLLAINLPPRAIVEEILIRPR